MLGAKKTCDLYAKLRGNGSLTEAILQALQLACDTTKSTAAVVAVADEFTRDYETIHVYDPHGILPSSHKVTNDSENHACPESKNGPGECGTSDTERLHRVCLPLQIGTAHVGTMTLWRKHETVTDAPSSERLAPLDVVLATLIAAEQTLRDDHLRSTRSLRDRIPHEIKRAKRFEREFSVVHIRVANGGRMTDDDNAIIEQVTQRCRDVLAPRLRETDDVAMAAFDRLMVLLTGTPLLGARIAVQRMRQFLIDASYGAGANAGREPSLSYCIKCFPNDGGDASSLCEPDVWQAFDHTSLASSGAGAVR